jgi:hypothetical protein
MAVCEHCGNAYHKSVQVIASPSVAVGFKWPGSMPAGPGCARRVPIWGCTVNQTVSDWPQTRLGVPLTSLTIQISKTPPMNPAIR